MSFNTQIVGLGAFNRALGEIAASEDLKGALQSAASGLHDAAIARLRDGQAPESAARALAASLELDVSADGMSATLGTQLDDGWQLEFGSLNRAARPWLQPAFHDAQPGILARIRRWAAGPGKRSSYG